MLQAWRSRVQVPDVVDFLIHLNFQLHYGPGIDSASIKNEYQESSLGKKRPASRADNLAAICEPNVWKCGSLNLSQP
jgi:hypothetical protein